MEFSSSNNHFAYIFIMYNCNGIHNMYVIFVCVCVFVILFVSLLCVCVYWVFLGVFVSIDLRIYFIVLLLLLLFLNMKLHIEYCFWLQLNFGYFLLIERVFFLFYSLIHFSLNFSVCIYLFQKLRKCAS